jgi:hypothetical protein
VCEHHMDDHEDFIKPEWQKHCHSSFDPAGSVGVIVTKKPSEEARNGTLSPKNKRKFRAKIIMQRKI